MSSDSISNITEDVKANTGTGFCKLIFNIDIIGINKKILDKSKTKLDAKKAEGANPKIIDTSVKWKKIRRWRRNIKSKLPSVSPPKAHKIMNVDNPEGISITIIAGDKTELATENLPTSEYIIYLDNTASGIVQPALTHPRDIKFPHLEEEGNGGHINVPFFGNNYCKF